MPKLNKFISVAGAGINISRSVDMEADGGSAIEIDLPVAWAGTLTTRTDNANGTITMADAGHVITTSSRVDLFWEGGSRRNVIVGTVSGTSVPITPGEGDNLPTQGSALVVAPRVTFNCFIDGEDLALIAMQLWYQGVGITARGNVRLIDESDTNVGDFLLSAYEPRIWDIAAGDDNPFISDPVLLGHASNGSTVATAKLLLTWLQDITP